MSLLKAHYVVLHILWMSTLYFAASTVNAATIDIRNNCPFTVWAAALPGGGRQLGKGQTWILNLSPGTKRASVWARTNCHFDGAGHGRCQTGDCGGLLRCQCHGQPPNTAVEYQFGNTDFFDLSLVDGFNVPMDSTPTSNGCIGRVKCLANINGQCPAQLRAPGGCYNPCTVFKTKQCCNSGKCGTTDFSRFFKDLCPDAFSYSMDDPGSIFSCPGGTNYRVVFCP